ncbi:hydroxymethylbilane synthase [bacterium]|nr:hydroxymethylbilane synthase [bacterium]
MTDTRTHPPSSPVRIGTRGSRLALWQAHYIRDRLTELDADVEITVIKTQGDRIQDVPLADMDGKGFFTKELEEAQLAGEVDLAVHSMKDLATEMPPGLALAAMVGREDPRESFLMRRECVDGNRPVDELLPVADGARIGTSAARRQAQLRDLRPDLEIADLRGNVPTRVNKLRDGQYDAILLAKAGLMRLELDVSDLAVIDLAVDRFVPAPAQGMLAIQCRDEAPWLDFLGQLHAADAARSVAAERRLLAALEGGCQLPFGVNVAPDGQGFRLLAFWRSTDSDQPAVRLDLRGVNPDVLADEALAVIREAAESDSCTRRRPASS